MSLLCCSWRHRSDGVKGHRPPRPEAPEHPPAPRRPHQEPQASGESQNPHFPGRTDLIPTKLLYFPDSSQ